MKLRATKLYARMAKRFGKQPADTARHGRHLGESRVGFPQGRPGPGGGVFITDAEQLAVYLLGLAASPTALHCAKVVQQYRILAAELQSTPEYAAEDLPEPLGFIRDEPQHSLLSALTRLITASRTAAGRERLESTFELWVFRDPVFPRARIVYGPLCPERIDVSYISPELFAGDYSRFAGHTAPEVDVQHPCIIGSRTILELGELLGEETKCEDASSAEANEASSGRAAGREGLGLTNVAIGAPTPNTGPEQGRNVSRHSRDFQSRASGDPSRPSRPRRRGTKWTASAPPP